MNTSRYKECLIYKRKAGEDISRFESHELVKKLKAISPKIALEKFINTTMQEYASDYLIYIHWQASCKTSDEQVIAINRHSGEIEFFCSEELVITEGENLLRSLGGNIHG